ncbi:NAD(P)H-binding protein [Altererythrobacter confluentis]|uniref:NAD(P)H-binding protein n=1 Tax=Allopontixanthobacter confluentis TaxID=1849021 RepID=A0A6L7GEV9_9SPHN|nr:NAD(P)H-binding protein [Allopontixanthobacter confluentis]MXP13578.1 NAD(P)H-binding protein [Allopontixanthobacter confluentis]
MSEQVRIALVGATGLVGRAIVQASTGREDMRLVAIARREMKLPTGARMEMFVADPTKWNEVIDAVKPDVLINALGTTWKKSGKDEAAFRSVDEQLVMEVACAAHKAGVKRFISISSVGASLAAKNFYLRVKGEVERDLGKVGFKRLDILRPGLLRGLREHDMRAAEGLGRLAAPLMNLALHGSFRQYRAIRAETVADAALALAFKKAGGKFAHDNDAIIRAAQALTRPVMTP